MSLTRTPLTWTQLDDIEERLSLATTEEDLEGIEDELDELEDQVEGMIEGYEEEEPHEEEPPEGTGG
jgi:hypothetical protein